MALERLPASKRSARLEVIAEREAAIQKVIAATLRALNAAVVPAELRTHAGSKKLPPKLRNAIDKVLDKAAPKLLAVMTDPETITKADPVPIPTTLFQMANIQVGELIQGLKRTQRIAIQEQLLVLFEEGPSAEVLEGLGQTAGLTPRQVRSVHNAQARALNAGATATAARRAATAARDRALEYRAQLIARTEAVRFTNGVVQARGEELGKGTKKQWVSARDSNVDEICINLDNGKKIDINKAFGGGTYSHPPAHPGCRCVIEIFAPDAASEAIHEGDIDPNVPKVLKVKSKKRTRTKKRVVKKKVVKRTKRVKKRVKKKVVKKKTRRLKAVKKKKTKPRSGVASNTKPYKDRPTVPSAVRYAKEEFGTDIVWEMPLKDLNELNRRLTEMKARGVTTFPPRMFGGKKATLKYNRAARRAGESELDFLVSGRAAVVPDPQDLAWYAARNDSMQFTPRAFNRTVRNHNFNTQFYSTGNRFDTITHEMAHVLHNAHRTGNRAAAKLWRSNQREWAAWTTPLRSEASMVKTARKVSGYATFEPVEFVAETYNALYHGATFDSDVMKLYRIFGGPTQGLP